MNTAAGLLWLAFVAILSSHSRAEKNDGGGLRGPHDHAGPSALFREKGLDRTRALTSKSEKSEKSEKSTSCKSSKKSKSSNECSGSSSSSVSRSSSSSDSRSSSSSDSSSSSSSSSEISSSNDLDLVPTIRSCEGLEELVFDLTTRVEDVGIETLRFRSLADDLEITSLVAKEQRVDVADGEAQRRLGLDLEGRRELFGSDPGITELGYRVSDLDRLKELLSSENNRIEGLNEGLHTSAVDLISRNADLRQSNSDISAQVTRLTAENAALQAERDELANQIDDLGDHINNLSGLLDDHAELNGQLNVSTAELAAQIAVLEAANAEYANQNEILESQIGELENQNLALAEQNTILAGLNQDLNATAENLNGQVGRLEGQVNSLTIQNDELRNTVDDLTNETNRLAQINDGLEANVESLQEEVETFANRTAELEGINQGLETIASFLNETAGDLDETYQALTEHLAQQIDAYRSIASETLKNVYNQRVDLWDCSYRDHFGDEPFGSDEDLAIPNNKLDIVMNYIDERVLQQLCLTKNDFELYLSETFVDPVFTSSHFVSGINSYTTLVLDYYFPDAGEDGGLTNEDWALASFACENLPNDKRFFFSPQ